MPKWLFLITFFVGQLLAEGLPVVREITGILRSRDAFVEDVLGISEEDFAKKVSSERKAFFDGKCGKGKDFECGLFEQQSLKDLRKNLPAPSASEGSFHVVEAEDPKSNLLELQQVDTGALQVFWGKYCQAKGKRLTVMDASNSNALETTGPADTPSTITKFIGDPTQGPAASMSAAPGTLWRHYFAFYKPGDTSGHWDQMQIKPQINFLDNLLGEFKKESGITIEVPNGYLILPSAQDQLDKLAAFFEQKSDLIRVGIHTNVSVSHGFDHRGSNARYFINDKQERPFINQIFCAALNMGPFAGGHDKKNPLILEVAEILLKKQIEATILTAWKNNTDILLLTLLGCGVFENKLEWFSEALTAHKDIIKKSGMRVVLNCFAPHEDKVSFQKSLEKLVQETGGSYLRYSQKDNKLFCKNLVSKDASYEVKLSEESYNLAENIRKFQDEQKKREAAKREQAEMESNKKFAHAFSSDDSKEFFRTNNNNVGMVLVALKLINPLTGRKGAYEWESYLTKNLSRVLSDKQARYVIEACGVVGASKNKVYLKDFEKGIASIANQCGDAGFKAVLLDSLEAIKKQSSVVAIKLSLEALQTSMIHLKKALGCMSGELKNLRYNLAKGSGQKV